MRPLFDERDQAILDERRALLDAVEGPRVGDWVVFADDVERRISYIWGEGQGDGFWVHPGPARAQTSDSGSYYLGDGYVSMSGGLHPTVRIDTFTLTNEARDGSVWFFHHDRAMADNGVDVVMPFRVFRCSLPAPT